MGDNSWNGSEHNCLFANVGGGQFMDVARPTGSDCVKDGRGVAVADFDGDGRLDVVINNNNETPTLYLNDLKRSGNAVELRLVGAVAEGSGRARSTRDALGACVRLTAGGKTMTRHVEAGGGYASESMRPLHFGLGAADHVDAVEIIWPSGRVQRIGGEELRQVLGVNRLVTIKEAPGASADVVVQASPLARAGGGSAH